ncbi:hypothetical protein RJ640_029072 [Escallonia rubra]|uniref:Uncharacterized protein n=1 Tax=Escallonia rubra TaxID=112253 RepID=A0AA88SNT4_9ASTE|nr:hypothetical protein RJ640_029072 [Escallonia rubra]
MPCGGISGLYGRSDQSRDEENSDLPLRKVSSRQLHLSGLSCVSVTNGPFIDGRMTGIEPARGGFTIHCLDPLGYIRPYPRTGETKLQQVEASWQSFKQRGWAVHFIDLTELDLRLKRASEQQATALTSSKHLHSYQNEKQQAELEEPSLYHKKPFRVSASVFLLVSALPSAGFALSIHLFFQIEI